MDRIKATMLLAEIKGYLTAGNPVWDVDEIAEACDMAIEALRNEINCVKCEHHTERETPTGIKGVCKMDTAHREDLISRRALCQYALNQKDKSVTPNDIMRFPSAEPKTGKWKLDPDGMDWNIPAWRCSECGFVANYIGVEANGFGNNPMNWAGSKFCPQCGVRITGDER